MSWHCSVESAEDFSLQDYLAGLRSAQSKKSRIEEGSSCNVKGTDCSNPSPSGTTSKTLMERHGGGLWTSSQGDSHVKTSPRPDGELVLPGSVQDYGSRCVALLEKYDLALYSPKTARTFVRVDSAPSSQNLQRWGMTAGGVCWGLGTSARRTNASACGYWPTLKASAAGPDLAKMKRSSTGISLQTALALLPDSGQGPDLLPEAKKKYLETGFYAGKGRGQMTPEFAEWLMGFPIGWSGSAPLETRRFRRWLQSHGASCRTD